MFTKWCTLCQKYLSYSPNKLVLSKKTNFVSVLCDKLTTLDDTLKFNILLDTVNAPYSVCQAFISEESN